MSTRPNGAIPWTKCEDIKEGDTTKAGIDTIFSDISDFLPIFQASPDGVYPNQSSMDDRGVEEVMYKLQDFAEELDGTWHMFQMRIDSLNTGVSSILKMFRTDNERPRRYEIGGSHDDEVIVEDMWGSRNYCLLIKQTRPMVIPVLRG